MIISDVSLILRQKCSITYTHFQERGALASRASPISSGGRWRAPSGLIGFPVAPRLRV